MSINVKPFIATTFSAFALLVAGCTTYEQPRNLPTQVQPQVPQTPVDGRWLDKDGIISSFSGGKFETRTADSNTILAVGNYTMSGNVAEIELTSVLKQTRSNVNCAIVAPYLLNCTPSQGSQFSLYKPSQAPIGFTLADASAMTASATQQPMTQGSTMAQQPMGTAPQTGYPNYQTAYPSAATQASGNNVNFSSMQSGTGY